MITPQDPGSAPTGYEPGTPPYPPPDPMGYPPPPGPTGYMPPPPPPPRSNRGTWIRAAILLVIVAVIVGGFILFRDRLSNDVTSLAPGECFDEPTAEETITDIQRQPCNEPHDAEVIAALTHPADPSAAYPVVSGFDDYIRENCVPIFESYTGRTFPTETELDLGYFRPTLAGWGEGDRGFSCYLSRSDGQKLTASLRGMGASPLP